MPTYASPLDPASATPEHIASALRSSLIRAERQLSSITEETAVRPLAPGKWSAKETIGHLIDSCTNNLQRLIRLQLTDSLRFPGYSQEDCVRIQRFDIEPWPEVISLFMVLNRHFAHVIQYADQGTFHHTWMFEGDHLTLAFILTDYLGHLEHHLQQLPNYTPAE